MDPLTIGLIGSGVGSLLGGLFGRRRAKKAEAKTDQHLQQIPGILEPHYRPFEEAGVRAIPTLEQQYAQLISNPELLLNQIGGSYNQSPGYRWRTDEAIRAANQAATAGGMLGTPAHQQSLMSTVSGLADQDYYNYLQSALGLYGMGLGGFGGLNQLGYNAASALGDNLASNQMGRANLSHSSGLNAAQSTGGMMGALGSTLGNIGGAIYGRYNPNSYWTQRSW